MEKITYAFPKIKSIDPSVYIDAYNLLLECSNAHTPKDFTITLISMISRICPYDQAIAFFYDRYHKIADYYSVGTREGWLESYLNYFLKYINSDFNIMHRNFYYKDRQNVDTASLWKEYHLTSREKEVADMLCQGLNASRISTLLYISEATTYKHIAHIYKKVGVSSHQELLARMLSRTSLM